MTSVTPGFIESGKTALVCCGAGHEPAPLFLFE